MHGILDHPPRTGEKRLPVAFCHGLTSVALERRYSGKFATVIAAASDGVFHRVAYSVYAPYESRVSLLARFLGKLTGRRASYRPAHGRLQMFLFAAVPSRISSA
jgi:hypothetical protein